MSVKKKPLVVVTRKLPDSIETRMRELFDARLNLDDTPMTTEQIADAIRSADILVPTVTDEITEDLIKQPDCKVKLIANFGNGVDNIDVAAAHARGITVTNTPKVLTEDTADMTMALILAVPRRMIEGASILTEGKNWEGWSPTWMLGHRIGGKRLGIVGMGRIGQAVARRARAFGLQIHYHNRRPVAPRIAEELGATYWESLDQMLARMDIVSVNCPLTEETRGMIGAREYALMRPTAYFITTARGFIHDEAALEAALREKKIAGAGLDVWGKEPPPATHPLLKFDNVIVTAHTAGVTREARANMGRIAAEQMLDALDGKPVTRIVNPQVWPAYAQRFERAFGFAPRR